MKGSRASIDVSDKPVDSDSGSMDEYGDIDPGRFNEDGSFIGQYGKSSNPIDVWEKKGEHNSKSLAQITHCQDLKTFWNA